MKRNHEICGYYQSIGVRTNSNNNISFAKEKVLKSYCTRCNSYCPYTSFENCPYFSTIEELVEEDSLRREEDFIEMWLTS